METHLSCRCDDIVMALSCCCRGIIMLLSWFDRRYVLVGMCERDREVLYGGEVGR